LSQSSSSDEFDELFELEFDELFELEFDDEFELELEDEFELELEELFELELEDEFELESDELFEPESEDQLSLRPDHPPDRVPDRPPRSSASSLSAIRSTAEWKSRAMLPRASLKDMALAGTGAPISATAVKAMIGLVDFMMRLPPA
jgi:hypothetical protein